MPDCCVSQQFAAVWKALSRTSPKTASMYQSERSNDRILDFVRHSTQASGVLIRHVLNSHSNTKPNKIGYISFTVLLSVTVRSTYFNNKFYLIPVSRSSAQLFDINVCLKILCICNFLRKSGSDKRTGSGSSKHVLSLETRTGDGKDGCGSAESTC
ncbi:hypothetical protein RvY_05945 [Ramazzottius varieornatus]|uniref:Uncharacterized protein n=1 Tax=Ramazzottius varieornatus TaxID=947166 RepID=A0A1D1UWV2_RAMVA|nr:hypothetical protein RvY_05945 [Ramazzottius varieornatus]